MDEVLFGGVCNRFSFMRIRAALYWKFKKSMRLRCPPCHCNFPPPISLLTIAPGLANLTVTDCGKNNPDLNREMQKQFVDLLNEELKLHEAITEEHMPSYQYHLQ